MLFEIGLLNHAKQVAVRISEHDEIRSRRVPPWVTNSSDAHESFDLLVLPIRVQVEVQPAAAASLAFPCLKRQVGASVLRIAQNHPTAACWLTRDIPQRSLPERDHAIESVAVNDYRSNLHAVPVLSRSY
jgi:hypothetical protein